MNGEIVLKIGAEELSFPRKDVAVVRPRIEFTERDLEDDSPSPQQ